MADSKPFFHYNVIFTDMFRSPLLLLRCLLLAGTVVNTVCTSRQTPEMVQASSSLPYVAGGGRAQVVAALSWEEGDGKDRKRRGEADLQSQLDAAIAANAAVVGSVAPPATIMYVVSLQDVPGADRQNDGRLDQFRQDWAETCGKPLEFRVCPGEIDKRRGFGLTKTYVKCFQKALNDGALHPAFFEDDARLFDAGFCDGGDWSDAPHDALLFMLGGHQWEYGHSHDVPGYREATLSYGTYGFMVPRSNLKVMIDGYTEELNLTNAKLDSFGKPFASPDQAVYGYATRTNQRVYAVDPLIVKHVAGYSNTWKTQRGAIVDQKPSGKTRSSLPYFPEKKTGKVQAPEKKTERVVTLDNMLRARAIRNGVKRKGLGFDTAPVPEAVPRSRPVLAFNHNPKAGGGPILRVLDETFPCELNRKRWITMPVASEYTVDCCNKPLGFDETLQKASAAENRTFNQCHAHFCDSPLHRPRPTRSTCWVRIPEFDHSGIEEQRRAFVVSSIREPCSHFLSLWSYSSANGPRGKDGKGGFYHWFPEMASLYGLDPPYFNSSRDIATFRQWMRNKNVNGLMMERYLHSYQHRQKQLPPRESEAKKVRPKKEHVDCWVFVENYESSFIDCLRRFEAQGGLVDWERPQLNAMLTSVRGGKGGLERKRNHDGCSTYFDTDTAQLVEQGPEKSIYSKFGYHGCCSKDVDGSIKLP